MNTDMQKKINDLKMGLTARAAKLEWSRFIALALGAVNRDNPSEPQINVAFVTVSPAEAVKLLQGLNLEVPDTECDLPGASALLIVTDGKMEFSGKCKDLRLILDSARQMAAKVMMQQMEAMTGEKPVDKDPENK